MVRKLRSRPELAAQRASQQSSRELLAHLRERTQDEGATVNLNGPEVDLSICRAKDLDRDLESELMELLEVNMRSLYEQSAQGWDRRFKLKEMREAPSRFLLVRTRPSTASEEPVSAEGKAAVKGELAAYCIFRLLAEECSEDDPLRQGDEDEIEVAYCYELQVSPRHQGKGIGGELLECLEAIAIRSGMRKVVLTAFKHNPAALRFYRSRGYSPDGISPAEEAEADYVILSMALVETHPCT